MDILQIGFTWVVLATIVQGLTEALTNPFHLIGQWTELIKRATSLGVALLLTFGFQIDLSLQLIGVEPVTPIIGYIFTAVMVSIGSSIVNDLMNRYGKR